MKEKIFSFFKMMIFVYMSGNFIRASNVICIWASFSFSKMNIVNFFTMFYHFKLLKFVKFFTIGYKKVTLVKSLTIGDCEKFNNRLQKSYKEFLPCNFSILCLFPYFDNLPCGLFSGLFQFGLLVSRQNLSIR